MLPKPEKDTEIISRAKNFQVSCWIGANVTILAGVTIGHGSSIGAGSVVKRDIPSLSVAVGSPARVIRSE
jgi:acetyltransferase-like isoleucine patch superfamily enzyme